ncbi:MULTISPECIES: DUF7344 domain-containing protein [Natrialbaceae]|uniref:DUF7344 domain-containing protein n=1 Tax=Natrialbaceae TaxID=1644061 RepID=UPI00207CB8E4|nr:hypothetical protein [Natronococcus sp. CG52]
MVALDTVFELLRDERRRRYVLYYLNDRDGPVSVRELVTVIDEWEDDPAGRHDSLDTFEEIMVELKHVHLPRSSEVEFIQYDPDQGLIQIQGSPREFDALVTVARLIEKPDQ